MMNTTSALIGGCIRSVRYRVHVKEDPFSLLHPKWRSVLKNVCEIISEKRRTRTERVLDDLKMPKVVEISSTVAIVYHLYGRLAVLKMFLRLLSPSRGLRKLLKETVYK